MVGGGGGRGGASLLDQMVALLFPSRFLTPGRSPDDSLPIVSSSTILMRLYNGIFRDVKELKVWI